MNYKNWSVEDVQRRKQDELQEKVVGEYLDKYFYSTWTSTITRNTDKETQIKGLDLTVTSTNNIVYTIDEKAAVKWTNKDLQTFAFEIDSLNKNGDLYNGWFMTATKDAANDFWMLVWIDKANEVSFTKVGDIQQVTVSLIKKTDVYNYMHRKNITGIDLKNAANDLRENFKYNNNYKNSYINGYKITIQPNVSEHATNILLPRKTLTNQLSTYSAEVTTNNIRIIKRNVGIQCMRRKIRNKYYDKLVRTKEIDLPNSDKETILKWIYDINIVQWYVTYLMERPIDNDDVQDYIGEIFLILSEIPQEKWNNLYEQGKFAVSAYVTGVIKFQIVSQHSTIWFKYGKRKQKEIRVDESFWNLYEEE